MSSTFDREPTLHILRTPGAPGIMHDAARPFVLVSVIVRGGSLARRKVVGRYTTEAGARKAAQRRDEAF